jgi:hypothetical protein
VAITPLIIDQLPIKRTSLTDFTWSRFLVPYLCNYEGQAIFMDADMLCLDDIAKMPRPDDKYAVSVSKNKHRFEWASLIYYNCGHPSNRILTPEYIETAKALHGMQWLKEEEVGDLPGEWNVLAGYDEFRPDAKIVHYTQGLPIFPETEGTPYAQEWKDEHKAMNSVRPWVEIMGKSVHAAQTKSGRLVARLHKDAYVAQGL